MSARLSWSKKPGVQPYRFPVDLTLSWEDVVHWCSAIEPRRRWICTRRHGHDGRHAAGNGRQIVACWWSR